MKKAIKILTLALAAVMCVSSAAACGSKEESTANDTVVFGFNEKRDMASIYYLNFNKVTLNTDSAYVSEGTGSYLLEKKTVSEYYADILAGSSFIEFHDGFAIDKIEYDNLSYFSIDAYNPQTGDMFAATRINDGAVTQYTLNPGWNTLYVYVDREDLAIVGDEKIEKVRFYFDYDVSKDDEFKVYVDNFRMWTTDIPAETANTGNAIGEDYIYEFKYASELQTVSATMTSPNISDAAKITINKESRFTNSQSTSLKIEYKHHDDTAVFNSTVAFKDENMGPKLRKYETIEGSYMSFNIYNDGDTDLVCHLRAKGDLINAPYVQTFVIPARGWIKDAKVMISDLKAFYAQYSDVIMDVTALSFDIVGLKDGVNVYFDAIKVVKGGN